MKTTSNKVQLEQPELSSADRSNITLEKKIAPTRLDLERAFRFFSSNKSPHTLSRDDIKSNTETFFPNLSLKDYKLLISSGSGGGNGGKDQVEEMSMDELASLFQIDSRGDSQLKPDLLELLDISEAFNLFDPDEKGHLSDSVMKRFTSLVNKKNRSTLHFDRQTIMKEFDKDGDGQIGLADFARISSWKPTI